MDKIKTVDFKSLPVTFYDKQGEFYINATKVCRGLGKRLDNFMRRQETSDYISALVKSTKKMNGKIVYSNQVYENQNVYPNSVYEDFVKASARGENAGTWIHESLAIMFARWLSSDFAVWCDMQIKELRRPVSLPASEKHLQHRICLLSTYTETPFLQEKSVQMGESNIRFDLVDINEKNRRVVELKNHEITPEDVYNKIVIKRYPEAIQKAFGNNTTLVFVSPFGISPDALTFINMLKYDVKYQDFNDFIGEIYSRIRTQRAGDDWFLGILRTEFADLLK